MNKSTLQSSSCTATYHPSWKLSKLDKPDMWDTAGEIRTNSQVIYSCGSLHLDKQRQDDQQEPIYSSSVPIQEGSSLEDLPESMDDREGEGQGDLCWWRDMMMMMIYLSIYLSQFLSISLCISQSVFLTVYYLSVYHCFCLSNIYLSIYLSICEFEFDHSVFCVSCLLNLFNINSLLRKNWISFDNRLFTISFSTIGLTEIIYSITQWNIAN